MKSSRRPDWLPVDDARAAILSGLPTLASEWCTLSEAEARVLAEAVTSPLDLPPWDNSAMDGFAVRSADVVGASDDRPIELSVVDDVAAGGRSTRRLAAGEAIRVMTGAPVPDGADAVVRVEHTDGGTGIGSAAARVRIRSDLDVGRNIRSRGEDIRSGAVAIPAGTLLRGGELGVAAALGRSRLLVSRRPRVALLASGDELVDVQGFGEVLAGRRIVSSNSYSAAAQLREAGGTVVDLGIAADTPDSIRRALMLAHGCDALVTMAGMSVGEHDHMLALLEELETEISFWRVQMRPGSPFAFGRIGGLGGIPWFGLPGNPVSAVVTCELFVRPALLRMMGSRRIHSPVVQARLSSDLETGAGLTRFFRVTLTPSADGIPAAELTGSQGSGVLTSTVDADALLVVAREREHVAAGDVLPAILLGGRPLMAQPGYDP